MGRIKGCLDVALVYRGGRGEYVCVYAGIRGRLREMKGTSRCRCRPWTETDRGPVWRRAASAR